MKTRLVALIALFGGILSAQLEINYSYEMKYGDGMQVKPLTQDTTDYTYFENLLDINTYYGDNIYIYSQLEYSNPPVFGYSRTGLDSMLSAFYIEYAHNGFNLKLGDLYELYGRGLSYYALQDQNVDYDNSIKGLVLNYLLKENLEISTLVGTGEYAYRSILTKQVTDLKINNNVILGSVNYGNNYIGDLQFTYIYQSTLLSPDYIKNIYGKSEIGIELEQSDRASLFAQQYFLLPEAFWDFEPEKIDELFSDTLVINNFNINWNYSILNMDIYFDKAWIQYDKIYSDEVFGSRFYTSVYTDFMGTGITYEYKNYFTPYLIKTISNPPIAYREGNSILASRNVHSMNFGNEVGHQIDFNRQLIDNINVLGNLSLSHRHQKDGMAELSIMDFLAMNEDAEIYDYYPFRQMYLEVNGWALSERLYYKLGVDYFTELIFLNSGKNTYSLTFPTHWVWKLSNGSSVTAYLEMQSKTEKQLNPDFSLANEKNYTNNYLSFSYNHFGKWSLTGFYDREISKGKTSQWPGFDFSYYLNSTTQISLFYGDQKGGLVCANGICAEQPGFEDGFKVTFRTIF